MTFSVPDFYKRGREGHFIHEGEERPHWKHAYFTLGFGQMNMSVHSRQQRNFFFSTLCSTTM